MITEFMWTSDHGMRQSGTYDAQREVSVQKTQQIMVAVHLSREQRQMTETISGRDAVVRRTENQQQL